MHADRHRSSFNFILIAGLVVAAVGVISQAPFLVILGLGFAAYSWFTTPSQYLVFDDRLVIAYGRPRMRHVFFQQIERIDFLEIAIGNRLRVRLRNGRPLFLQPRDAEEFQTMLQRGL